MSKKLTPFKTAIKHGKIIPLPAAALLSGYSVQHLRRLCRARLVAHLRRGGCHVYFTPAQIAALTKDVRPLRSAASANRRGAYQSTGL